MKLRDEVPQHALNRTGHRIGMIDGITNADEQIGFTKNVVTEWEDQYRKLGVPDDKITAVMSMSTRVREFFGWKLGLDIVTAYRRGDIKDFHKLMSDFFSTSDDTFRAIHIEALMDMIPGNKTIKKDGLVQKVKDAVDKLRINSDGIKSIQAWLKKASYHFYEIGKVNKSQMTGVQVIEEFKKIPQ